jgi:two-component system NtrC family sensor kinase
VLDVVAQNAARVCAARDAVVFRAHGDTLRVATAYGPISKGDADQAYPIARDWISGRAVVDRRPVHVHDVLGEGEEYSRALEFARQLGHRTALATPLLREGVPVGAILIRRAHVEPFTDRQIELLQTFANQAVIAIENVRLFTELQARNR